MTKRPNILLVYTDQQRFDPIGALGDRVIRTPNLDPLVAEGITFTHVTTPCPVCLPAGAYTPASGRRRTDAIPTIIPASGRPPTCPKGYPVSLARRIRMVRTQEKYVEEIGGTCESYDLIHDPHELVNLWNRQEYTSVQRDLEIRLDAFKRHLPGVGIGQEES